MKVNIEVSIEKLFNIEKSVEKDDLNTAGKNVEIGKLLSRK